MKKLIYKLIAFSGCVALLLISYFSQPNAEINEISNVTSSAVPDTQFIIGAFNNGLHSQFNIINDSLKFNAWHFYTCTFPTLIDKSNKVFL